MIDAKQFVEETVESLRDQGRTVEVTESDIYGGKMLWAYSPRPNWYDKPISFYATYSNITKRWKLGEMKVDNKKYTTRLKMKIAAQIYGA